MSTSIESEPLDVKRLAIAVWWTVTCVLLASRLLLPILMEDVSAAEWWLPTAWLTELWVVMGVLVWAIRRAELRKRLAGVQLAMVGVVLGAASVVHLVPVVGDAYPFAQWNMYTMSESPMIYNDYLMVAANDEELGHLPLDDLVPNTVDRGFMARLDDLVGRAEDGDLEADRVLSETIVALLDELGHPAATGVQIRRCAVEEPTRALPARCDDVLSVSR